MNHSIHVEKDKQPFVCILFHTCSHFDFRCIFPIDWLTGMQCAMRVKKLIGTCYSLAISDF